MILTAADLATLAARTRPQAQSGDWRAIGQSAPEPAPALDDESLRHSVTANAEEPQQD